MDHSEVSDTFTCNLRDKAIQEQCQNISEKAKRKDLTGPIKIKLKKYILTPCCIPVTSKEIKKKREKYVIINEKTDRITTHS